MILARLTRAFREQNWFAVVLEFIIVIAGVVIGFQITEWRGERADRQLEAYYIERLHDDLVGTLDDYQVNLVWDETQLAAQTAALRGLRECSLGEVDRNAFLRGIIFAGSVNPLPTRSGTINELQSTGNIALIRDLRLREMLAEFDGQARRRADLIDGARGNISRLSPVLAQSMEVTDFGFTPDALFDATFDLQTLCEDRELRSALAAIDMRSRVVRAFNEGNSRHIQRIERYLAESLGRDPWRAEDNASNEAAE